MSDLIKREDLVKELNAQFAVGDITREIANDILNHIPSAEPERKKGHWIKHENPTLGHCLQIVYECSVCHKAHGCEYFIRRSFCPNCGADLRGE